MPDRRDDLPPEIRDRKGAMADGLLDEFDALEEAEDAGFRTPDTATQATQESMSAPKAVHRSDGRVSRNAAVEEGIDPERIASFENGAADAAPEETDVMNVPKDRLGEEDWPAPASSS